MTHFHECAEYETSRLYVLNEEWPLGDLKHYVLLATEHIPSLKSASVTASSNVQHGRN